MPNISIIIIIALEDISWLFTSNAQAGDLPTVVDDVVIGGYLVCCGLRLEFRLIKHQAGNINPTTHLESQAIR